MLLRSLKHEHLTRRNDTVGHAKPGGQVDAKMHSQPTGWYPTVVVLLCDAMATLRRGVRRALPDLFLQTALPKPIDLKGLLFDRRCISTQRFRDPAL